MTTHKKGRHSWIRGLAAKRMMHLTGLTASQKSTVGTSHNYTCNNLKLQGVAGDDHTFNR